MRGEISLSAPVTSLPQLKLRKYVLTQRIPASFYSGIYGPMIYKAPYIKLLMRANPLRGQVGVGWALRIFGPCVKVSNPQVNAIRGPKKSRFPRLNPLPFSLVMDLPAYKALRREPYQSEVHV
jgi:hypothetical protein